MIRSKNLLFLCISLCLSGCISVESKIEAQRLVSEFYKNLDQTHRLYYDGIFTDSFQTRTSEEELTSLVEKVRNIYGVQVGWTLNRMDSSLNITTRGIHTSIILVYSVAYSKSETTVETFLIVNDKGKLKIDSYNIQFPSVPKYDPQEKINSFSALNIETDIL